METWLKNNNEDTEWAKSTLLVNEPSSFKVKPIQQGCKKTFEHATWAITARNKTFSITGENHPPPKNRITNSMFIVEITEHLTVLLPTTNRNIVMGDFNMHVNNPVNADTMVFNDTFSTLELDQNVRTSTHYHGNILD